MPFFLLVVFLKTLWVLHKKNYFKKKKSLKINETKLLINKFYILLNKIILNFSVINIQTKKILVR